MNFVSDAFDFEGRLDVRHVLCLVFVCFCLDDIILVINQKWCALPVYAFNMSNDSLLVPKALNPQRD